MSRQPKIRRLRSLLRDPFFCKRGGIQNACILLADWLIVLYLTIGNGESLSTQIAGLNWTPFVLGLAVVGLEVGAIFMYKVGWEVSVGNIVQAIFVAIALLVVGVMVYKEPLTGTKLAGIAVCLVGIFLLNK